MSDEKIPTIPLQVLVESVIKYWPYITAVAVALWVVFTWLADQRRQVEVRLFEARKPYLTKKLDIFFDTAKTAGELTWLPPKSPEWKKASSRFLALRWSELQMGGTAPTRARMRELARNLQEFEDDSTFEKGYAVRRSIECLADDLRHSIELEWSTVPKVDDLGTKCAPASK